MTDRLDEALELPRLRRRLPPPDMRRLIRTRAGLSQEAAARLVGVDRASIARWELGAREPRDAHLRDYAALLDRLLAEVSR